MGKANGVWSPMVGVFFLGGHLRMDEILHHFEKTRYLLVTLVFARRSIMPGSLRWCEMDVTTIHSRGPYFSVWLPERKHTRGHEEHTYFPFLEKHRLAGFMTEFGAVAGNAKELTHLSSAWAHKEGGQKAAGSRGRGCRGRGWRSKQKPGLGGV